MGRNLHTLNKRLNFLLFGFQPILFDMFNFFFFFNKISIFVFAIFDDFPTKIDYLLFWFIVFIGCEGGGHKGEYTGHRIGFKIIKKIQKFRALADKPRTTFMINPLK